MKLDIQQLIGNTLRRGVTLACLLAALGGLYYLVTHGGEPVPDYRHFDPTTAAAQTHFTTLTGIVRGVAAFDAYSCIQLGVVALILTPHPARGALASRLHPRARLALCRHHRHRTGRDRR